jgi:choline dehydrogenase-like flavoprotein
VDTVIPADEWPGGWDGGVERLLAEHGGDLLDWATRSLEQACSALDRVARESSGSAFAQLDGSARGTVFGAVMDAGGPTAAALEDLITVCLQGFYGGTSEPAGWAMVGFTPEPSLGGLDPDPLTGIQPSALQEDYDVIIVGAGAGGGVAAAELAASGRRVLLVERSRPMRDRELRGNHLQGKRLQLYDVIAGPGAGNPRVLEHADGTSEILAGEGSGADYALVAMTLGGGTRVWQGMSWRFYEEDFAMASTYGVPHDSTLADWPFGYDELAPYYDRVEWELGVAGDASSAMARRTPRKLPYPMPPLPHERGAEELSRAADRLGWSASPIPFAINSVERDGRAACIRCPQCVGHTCPVNAKNGTHNTFIPRALATGNCDLLLNAQAIRVEHDGSGTATGVRLVIDAGDVPVERVVRARQVVLSAGAIETPRLLLASGLGNEWVGRNHHTHGISSASARSGPDVKTSLGPGHSVATVDFVHRDREGWGGGVIFDAPPMYPLEKAIYGRSLPGVGWGADHKSWMRTTGPLLGALSMVQEIPHVASRVTLDPVVRDRWGMPVARLRGEAHPASREAASYVAARCVEWLRAAGGRDITSFAFPGGARGAEHSAGTVRLAADPAMGACDERGRLFGCSNVFVADASLHTTNGGFNPGLTAMANALRVAASMPT